MSGVALYRKCYLPFLISGEAIDTVALMPTCLVPSSTLISFTAS